MSKLQDAFFITVITLMLVGTAAINKAQAAQPIEPQVKNAVMGKPYQVRGKTYYPMKSVESFVQQGIASWYGTHFHGKKTSSGELFNRHALTAAHLTLPLGTKVRVTNTKNGQSVVVKINDRGSFHANRVIDLSQAAARALGFVHLGLANVKIETLNFHQNQFITQNQEPKPIQTANHN